MKKKKSPTIKKIKRVVTLVNLAASLFTVIAAVYDLIPKYEKLDGIDAAELIAENTPCPNAELDEKLQGQEPKEQIAEKRQDA